MITIIDYGLGNLGSIANMIKKVGGKSKISSNINEISDANKLILPGVGAFDSGMKNLNSSGLTKILNKKVIVEKVPILGICLGMQLMTRSSEEGKLSGLGWINAHTIRFNFDLFENKQRIPHMGWNQLIRIKQNSLLSCDQLKDSRFYFVHSYFVNCNEHEDILFSCYYGIEFTAAFHRNNIYGVQFHPEKSHKFGMMLIKNFINF